MQREILLDKEIPKVFPLTAIQREILLSSSYFKPSRNISKHRSTQNATRPANKETCLKDDPRQGTPHHQQYRHMRSARKLLRARLNIQFQRMDVLL